LETLASAGLLRSRYNGPHDVSYSITPAGFERYTRINLEQGKPVERVQQQVRRYFDGDRLKIRYPGAFEKWQQAEELLWKEDSQRSLTTIGHLCREAMQEFGTALLRNARLNPEEPDPAKTVSRLRQFLNSRRGQLGNSHEEYLVALLALWGTTSDLAQRQEHGGQKAGAPLSWDDGRLLVFRLMMTIVEIDALA
jgi:hypothetical protein